MRISELSRRSGRSIATIKYYLREGLLPAGYRTSANQADYGEDHLRRLRLITILLEVGGLTITSIKIVVDAIDDESRTVHEVLGAAHHALALRVATPVAVPEHDEAEAEIDDYVRTLGWNVKADAARTSGAGCRPGVAAADGLADRRRSVRRICPGRRPDRSVGTRPHPRRRRPNGDRRGGGRWHGGVRDGTGRPASLGRGAPLGRPVPAPVTPTQTGSVPLRRPRPG